ncbi:hypothetical protein FOZ62_028055 [Perkinsus olseni]|uniref:Uncharacterized protein n=1 Tax=Perkinsus olseni TaxID=32597 RepID=A0A7J6QGZ4_PEROL|nr:hypothetical protein FOZ62_028055 [Perkinsus olseni]
MDVKVEPLLDGMFDVPQVATFLIAGPDGYIAQFIGQGLAIDGIYQGRGEGNFFVSFLEGQVYRYPNGIQSRQSVDLGLTDVFGDCPYDEAAGATLRPRDRRDFSLLMFCRYPASLAPTSAPGRVAYTGFAYDESTRGPRKGYLELADIAELSNGDIMVLFSEFDVDIMTIGYVKRRDMRRALRRGKPVILVPIADMSRSEG